MKRLATFAAAAALAFALGGSTSAQTVPTGVGLYDSRGQYFGNIIDQNKVWMRFPDGDAYVYIEKKGKLSHSVEGDFEGAVMEPPRNVYTSRDCSGVPYREVAGLPPPGYFDESEYSVRYPQRPYERIVARSIYQPSRAPNTPACQQLPDTPMRAGKLATYRLPRASSPLTIR